MGARVGDRELRREPSRNGLDDVELRFRVVVAIAGIGLDQRLVQCNDGRVRDENITESGESTVEAVCRLREIVEDGYGRPRTDERSSEVNVNCRVGRRWLDRFWPSDRCLRHHVRVVHHAIDAAELVFHGTETLRNAFFVGDINRRRERLATPVFDCFNCMFDVFPCAGSWDDCRASLRETECNCPSDAACAAVTTATRPSRSNCSIPLMPFHPLLSSDNTFWDDT